MAFTFYCIIFFKTCFRSRNVKPFILKIYFYFAFEQFQNNRLFVLQAVSWNVSWNRVYNNVHDFHSFALNIYMNGLTKEKTKNERTLLAKCVYEYKARVILYIFFISIWCRFLRLCDLILFLWMIYFGCWNLWTLVNERIVEDNVETYACADISQRN